MWLICNLGGFFFFLQQQDGWMKVTYGAPSAGLTGATDTETGAMERYYITTATPLCIPFKLLKRQFRVSALFQPVLFPPLKKEVPSSLFIFLLSLVSFHSCCGCLHAPSLPLCQAARP